MRNEIFQERTEAKKHGIGENKLDWDSSKVFSPSSGTRQFYVPGQHMNVSDSAKYDVLYKGTGSNDS